MPTTIASQLLIEPCSLALTFDDGPNEYWTPYVLGVLAQAEVSGTFFMIGEGLRTARSAAQAVLDAQLPAQSRPAQVAETSVRVLGGREVSRAGVVVPLALATTCSG